MDSLYILKGEPTGFPYRLNVGCERKGNQDDCKVFDPTDWKGGVAISEIGDPGEEEFYSGGSGVVLYASMRQLFDIQVIRALWEKEHPWVTGCRGHGVLREELTYRSSEKKKEPFREA